MVLFLITNIHHLYLHCCVEISFITLISKFSNYSVTISQFKISEWYQWCYHHFPIMFMSSNALQNK